MNERGSSAPIAPGDVLANGRYRVDSVLGEGGMGVVCAATHVALDQKVAIKFLLPEALEHRQAVARFEREARVSASMTSEHVVRVTDVGTLETGAPYFVMEFLEGEDLAQRLRRTGPLDPRAAVALMSQACEGLVEAHAKGLVHRDIKPSNLFLAKRAAGKAVLKVIDFGIAKADATTEGGGHELTRTSEIMGSPKYMSPEQLRDTKNVDARSDIWSLGASFFECLTGVPPFTGETITDLVVKIAIEPPLDPLTVRPDLSKGLVTILMRCLAKKPADRFASASDLIDALEALRGSMSSMAVSFTDTGTPIRVADQSGSFMAFDATAATTSATQQELREAAATATSHVVVAQKKPPFAMIAAAVAVLLVGGGLAWKAKGGAAREQANQPIAVVPAPSPVPTPASAPSQGSKPEAAPVAVDPPVVATDAGPSSIPPTAGAQAKQAPTRVVPAKVVAAPSVAPAPAAAASAKDAEKKRRYDPGFE